MLLSNVEEREALLIFADDPKTIRRLEKYLRTTQKWEVDELIEHFCIVFGYPRYAHLHGDNGTHAERLAAVRDILLNQALEFWKEIGDRTPTPRSAIELMREGTEGQ
jgi:hypothetical protein